MYTVHEDSALITAVEQGHVLMVDEADKAPREVVCVLKGLVDGDMVPTPSCQPSC